MSFETDFAAFIEAGVTGNVYPLMLPDKRSYPALTYELNNSRPEYAADGPTAYQLTMEVNCWATTYLEVKTAQAEVRALIDGYTGPMGSFTVFVAQIENELDDYEADTELYRVTILINLLQRANT